eukprot:7250489-Prymnesium_polylepis.2
MCRQMCRGGVVWGFSQYRIHHSAARLPAAHAIGQSPNSKLCALWEQQRWRCSSSPRGRQRADDVRGRPPGRLRPSPPRAPPTCSTSRPSSARRRVSS